VPRVREGHHHGPLRPRVDAVQHLVRDDAGLPGAAGALQQGRPQPRQLGQALGLPVQPGPVPPPPPGVRAPGAVSGAVVQPVVTLMDSFMIGMLMSNIGEHFAELMQERVGRGEERRIGEGKGVLTCRCSDW
jgi:hypothetical protein